MSTHELFQQGFQKKRAKFPEWLHRKLPVGDERFHTHRTLAENRLHTVCEEAKCPNLIECYSKKTATFLLMGKECTRSCAFCEIDFSKTPKALDPEEPERVADAVFQLGLRHAVVTQVARDDLEDGGACHLVAVLTAIRKKNPGITVEALVSDFAGNFASLDLVLASLLEVFNHNIETVERLTPQIRHKATYERTLRVLSYAKQHQKKTLVKSGLMVGLGEEKQEVHKTLLDLRDAGCDIITIGQYLQPSKRKTLVKEFVHPEVFKEYEQYARSLGIPHAFAGPFVRSSYNAHLFAPNALEEQIDA
jgi:lipoic acid synthetase